MAIRFFVTDIQDEVEEDHHFGTCELCEYSGDLWYKTITVKICDLDYKKCEVLTFEAGEFLAYSSDWDEANFVASLDCFPFFMRLNTASAGENGLTWDDVLEVCCRDWDVKAVSDERRMEKSLEFDRLTLRGSLSVLEDCFNQDFNDKDEKEFWLKTCSYQFLRNIYDFYETENLYYLLSESKKVKEEGYDNVEEKLLNQFKEHLKTVNVG